MAELSTNRANFYRQIYFPSVYYKDVFEATLQEAGEIKKAQDDLLKLLTDADQNLARLSETFRERSLSPGQRMQVIADREAVRKDIEDQAAGAKTLRAFAQNPAAPTITKIDSALRLAQGQAPSLPVTEKTKIVASELSKALQGQKPAVQRKIAVDIAKKYGVNADIMAVAANALGQPSLTWGALQEQAKSAEDRAVLDAMAGDSGTGQPATPEGKKAQANLDALSSPFANGSTEQTDRIASGLDDDRDDELLRLYLSRLQDRESPGVITDDEIVENPDLALGEAIYQDVQSRNSFLKSQAKWFSAEYLAALRTRAQVEKKMAENPFKGLDPYRWAQQEALKRGGYTKESLLHLKMLTERPDVAPYVGPAFTRLRADGGLEPKSGAEATIKAAFDQNPNLTLAELDALLKEKRQAITSAGRQVGRETEGGARSWEAADIRKASRTSAKDLYGTPEAAEEAKAYLLALRLNRAGTPATPDTGSKIEIPVSKADVPPTPDAAAGAAAERARVKAMDVMMAAMKSFEGKAKPTTPEEEDIDLSGSMQTVTVDEGFVTDRTNPDYSYRRMPDGSYMYAFKGIPQDKIQPGTRAFRSVESVLAGGDPLPPPPRKPARVDFSAVPAATVTNPSPAPAPAPAKPSASAEATPPPPSGSRVKTVRDPVTGRLVQVKE